MILVFRVTTRKHLGYNSFALTLYINFLTLHNSGIKYLYLMILRMAAPQASSWDWWGLKKITIWFGLVNSCLNALKLSYFNLQLKTTVTASFFTYLCFPRQNHLIQML